MTVGQAAGGRETVVTTENYRAVFSQVTAIFGVKRPPLKAPDHNDDI